VSAHRVVGGGEARGLISLIPQSGEDECGPGHVGKAERHLDATLAYGIPDYRSHSFRSARSFALSHYYNVRASAKRYEERYDRKFLESTRDCLSIAALDPQRDDRPSSPGEGPTEQWMLAFMEKPLQ
jgi:hypothetical protein